MKNRKIDIESLKKQNIHQIPDGYFDQLPLKVQSRIEHERIAAPSLSVFSQPLTWPIAAAIVLFVAGWFYLSPSPQDFTADQLLTNVQSEDMIAYLYEETLGTYDILTLLDESTILDELSPIDQDLIDPSISAEDLEKIYSELDYSTEIM
ncbi:hypothetical protein N7E81_14315 [Reichenbachiella carrageenanivorans]|uniref:Uncharacterized protein n=1 Tax=Reichenbachiella carrageenanivorans TaxID=2979869 RepID=A0ABY6CX92_9BACT|nr:hypothetical protein [Reichenbachiella carrageenanivorans]UXX78532.1 hypothetical protein N7E81_14315 [Reichenbachiella carrageenanivorans]